MENERRERSFPWRSSSLLTDFALRFSAAQSREGSPPLQTRWSLPSEVPLLGVERTGTCAKARLRHDVESARPPSNKLSEGSRRPSDRAPFLLVRFLWANKENERPGGSPRKYGCVKNREPAGRRSILQRKWTHPGWQPQNQIFLIGSCSASNISNAFDHGAQTVTPGLAQMLE